MAAVKPAIRIGNQSLPAVGQKRVTKVLQIWQTSV
jgi:hypothetical protein